MEEKQLTNGQIIKIGLAAGLMITILGFIMLYKSMIELASNPDALFGFLVWIIAPIQILFYSCVPGVLGALLGKRWKKSLLATWIGAILGAIVGVSVRIGFIFLLG